MIISDLYKVIITANKYETNIDSEDVIITVTVKDFNNQPVTGKTIDLTVDKGVFTKKGNSNVSATKSLSALSDSNGQMTAQWKANEWGLCTFTVGNNSANIQILVKGWKYLYGSPSHNLGFIRTNGDIVDFHLVTGNKKAKLTNTAWTHLGGWINFSSDASTQQYVKYNIPFIFYSPTIKQSIIRVRVATAQDVTSSISNGQWILEGTSYHPDGSDFLENGWQFEINGSFAIR